MVAGCWSFGSFWVLLRVMAGRPLTMSLRLEFVLLRKVTLVVGDSRVMVRNLSGDFCLGLSAGLEPSAGAVCLRWLIMALSMVP